MCIDLETNALTRKCAVMARAGLHVNIDGIWIHFVWASCTKLVTTIGSCRLSDWDWLIWLCYFKNKGRQRSIQNDARAARFNKNGSPTCRNNWTCSRKVLGFDKWTRATRNASNGTGSAIGTASKTQWTEFSRHYAPPTEVLWPSLCWQKSCTSIQFNRLRDMRMVYFICLSKKRSTLQPFGFANEHVGPWSMSCKETSLLTR
jgi:hypothetical protein